MSPRRRLLVLAVAVALVGLSVLGVVRIAGDSTGPGFDQAVPQDRPGPVLLVPGYGGSTGSLTVLAARLRASGRSAQVVTLAGDGRGDLGAQVAVLDAAVDAALVGGARSVDLVGYSAGGVVAALWVARADGAGKVRRVVTLGAPFGGARVAALGATYLPDTCPPACSQLAPGSAVLDEVARAEVARRVPWLSVWSADDQTVTPPDSARLAGAGNVELRSVCPDARVAHSQLPTDPLVTGLVLRAVGTAVPPAPVAADCAGLRAQGRS